MFLERFLKDSFLVFLQKFPDVFVEDYLRNENRIFEIFHFLDLQIRPTPLFSGGYFGLYGLGVIVWAPLSMS